MADTAALPKTPNIVITRDPSGIYRVRLIEDGGKTTLLGASTDPEGAEHVASVWRAYLESKGEDHDVQR